MGAREAAPHARAVSRIRFARSFVVRAPIEAVRAFHQAPEAVLRLTPVPLRIVGEPPPVAEGARIRFVLGLRPVRVFWCARYEEVRDDGFVDVMEEGPFAAWRHEHRWRSLPGGETEVTDSIEATPGGAVSRLILAGLRPTFAYRALVTRRACEGADRPRGGPA